MEELAVIIESTKEQMDKVVAHLISELMKIRAGKASPNMLKGIMVDYYGSATALEQVANVGTPDAMTLTVQPWEKNMLKEIEKAILIADLGLNPTNNGEGLIISVPPLTKERRLDLVKQVKSECESAKVSLRNSRKEANSEIKKLEDVSEDIIKDKEQEIQKMTDEFVKKIDAYFVKKEVEITTV